MMGLFFILTIVSLPIILLYKGGEGVDSDFDAKSSFGHYSIANLGMDSVRCTTIPFELKKFDLTCPYGKISNIK